jgi:hypothetical protein
MRQYDPRKTPEDSGRRRVCAACVGDLQVYGDYVVPDGQPPVACATCGSPTRAGKMVGEQGPMLALEIEKRRVVWR